MVNRCFFWASVRIWRYRIRISTVCNFLYLLGSDQDTFVNILTFPGSGSGWARHFCTYRIQIWTGLPFLYLSDPDVDVSAISVPIGSGSGQALHFCTIRSGSGRARRFCTYRLRIWTGLFFSTSGSGPIWWGPTLWCSQGPDPDGPVISCPCDSLFAFASV